MGRTYKRKVGSRKYKDYSDEKLRQCLDAVRTKQMSQREASQHFNIARRTIINKLAGKHSKKPGCPPIFSDAEEKKFVDCITKMSDYGFPVTEFDLRMVIKDFLAQQGRTVVKFKDNVPGHEWVASFIKRHSVLTQRFANNIKKARAAVTATDLISYISALSPELEGIPPSNIFNFDETNLTDEPGKKQAIVRRGTKYVEHIRNTSRTGHTLMFCGSASGVLLPLFVVYKSKQMWDTWKQGGPPGAVYRNTLSGWFDAAMFLEWFQLVFLPSVRKLSGRKVVICDNLALHISLKVLELCDRNDIAFVCLPPNSSHIIQPLDVAVFAGVKRTWRKLLSDWKDANGNENFSKQDLPPLLKQLWETIHPYVEENLRSGFRACGISPTNVEELLKRIPSQDLQCDHDHEVIENCFIGNLEKKRRQWTEKKTVRRRKKVQVTPGKALEASDFADDSHPTSSLSTTRHSRRRARAETVESDSEVDLDEEAIIQDESDLEDFQSFCQRQLEENEDVPEELVESNEVLKAVVRETGQYCVVKYDNSFYPGVVLSFDEETAKVRTMIRGKKSWRWPEKEDILDYTWENVFCSIDEPRCISRTRKLFDVPEMTQFLKD